MEVYGALFWVGGEKWELVEHYLSHFRWVGVGGNEWEWVGMSGGGCTV